MEVYIRAYSAPGGMRSAFQLYREILNNDIAVYEKFFQSKLLMPVLVLAGDASASGPFLKEMATEFFANSTYKVVRGAGHWLTDEYPEEVAEYLLAFLGASNQ
jgi:pimeloyl-ACP methyl ester carboxylesterase